MLPNESMKNLQEKLTGLRADYATKLKDRVGSLHYLFTETLTAEDPTRNLYPLEMQLHKLAGSGATMGFPSVSLKAKAAELYLREQRELTLPLHESFFQNLKSLLNQLSEVLSESPQDLKISWESSLTEKSKKPSAKVLIVDDDPYIAEYLVAPLNVNHIEASICSKVEFLELGIKKIKPNLILMDVLLGHCSGFDVIQNCKSELNANHISFLFMSTTLTESVKKRAAELGSTALAKPIQEEELLNLIRKALSQ